MKQNIETKKTNLYHWHQQAGAKFTPFAGWDMPVIYTSIVQEHLAVRNTAGLFDISHMGQIEVSGKNAFNFLQLICTNDLAKLSPHRALYSHICNENGGVIDDIFIYALSANNYLVVVNAATIEKDFNWMKKNILPEVELKNLSDSLGMMALQGPQSENILAKLFQHLPQRNEIQIENVKGQTVYICRTGYTGEDGFEIISPNELTETLWKNLMNLGAAQKLTACGLGARDTLRLEAGFLLYGQDVDDEHTSIESGPAWVVQFNKKNFIGKTALFAQKQNGAPIKLKAFKLNERGIPRHNSKIFHKGQVIGNVTSGTFSPILQQGIALGYVPTEINENFSIECGTKQVPAALASVPFHKK